MISDYATNIAIVRNGTVEQIIWGNVYQVQEFEQVYDCTAVVIDDLFVQAGDAYNGEYFTHGGQRVLTRTELFNAEQEQEDNFLINELYEAIIEGVE